MSGGHYDYAYSKLLDFIVNLRIKGGCHTAPPVVRQAFKEHLLKVSEAMKAIEWNDSGDGDRNEEELIMKCISNSDVLQLAIDDAKKSFEEFKKILEKIEKE